MEQQSPQDSELHNEDPDTSFEDDFSQPHNNSLNDEYVSESSSDTEPIENQNLMIRLDDNDPDDDQLLFQLAPQQHDDPEGELHQEQDFQESLNNIPIVQPFIGPLNIDAFLARHRPMSPIIQFFPSQYNDVRQDRIRFRPLNGERVYMVRGFISWPRNLHPRGPPGLGS